ncbi:MAG: adenylate kinase [Clostridiaceae bacterium]|nr:adenylate kinase [Clostridia bacterium]MDY3870085.1 adenylate kinase [Clostridiaceae bacterium]
MKLILLGAPGAGKGTQADFIKAALKVPVISTGNLLREAIAQGTELGRQAKSYMDGGKLVPDELIIGLVKEKLASHDCERGAIFDGFPRTVAQAEAMESFTDVDAALSIEVPDEAIVHRMAGRRTCPKCHATYHVEGNPPKVEGVCDKCGEKLGIRPDDDPEVVLQRLEVYHAQTEPVKEHYAQLGKLRSVEGIGSVDEIRKRIFDTLGLNV